jgi:16S rRNA (guanine527-N7)-methyltransferase
VAERQPADRRDLLRDGLERLGYEATDDRLGRLLRYVDEIELWNPKAKLVAASGRELIVRHILDSLAGAAALFGAESGPTGTLADAGTGAGLPGIPIAIAYPDLRVDLVERSGRRVGFLRNAVAVAHVQNASVLETDIERYSGPADVIVHRAFLPLSVDVLTIMKRPLRPGGTICAYKGRRDAINAELQRLSPGMAAGGGMEVQIVPVHVPFLHEERHLVLIRTA